MAFSSSSSPFLSLDIHFCFSSTSPLPLSFSKPPPRTIIVCNSSSSSTQETASTPSLSDQLKPLAVNLLKQPTPQPVPPSAPKSTWINPSRPKPSVLSLRRHKRTPYSLNPSLKSLTHLARSLSSLPTADSFSAALSSTFPSPPSRDDALLLLNSLRSWQKSHLFFLWLKNNTSSPLDTIFYNVAMKGLRSGRQYSLVEQLADEMIELGVQLDNVTYSTIITTASRCRQYDKAIWWFERMYKTGVMPDEVTYSAVLDVYAKLGKKEEVLSLYERARAGGWNPDTVAFSVLAKMFGEVGDYDGIRYVLREMESVGVKPDLVVYNTLLEAMGRVGKPGLARSLFEEMVAGGVSPNEKTLTALIKIYGKARWSRDALQLWERMRANNWPMDFILYNTLLSMCADLGMEEEAEELFQDMKRPERGSRPDSWSYTAMINIYASGGKADQALEVFDEMLRCKVEPNVMGCTCLIQCLGKARRIGDAARVFETAMQRGIKPDDRLCGCLLSLVALCEEGEVDIVLKCLKKSNSRLVKLIEMLGDEEASFDAVKQEFQGILNEATADVRRPFCNCLIDVCRNRNFPPRRAHELLYLGTVFGLYPGLQAKGLDEWSLNLKSLSVGAANTAFEEWLRALLSSADNEEAMPRVFAVHTGSGNHKFSQGLAGAFASHLKTLAAPFQQDGERSGCFVASKEDLFSWMESRVLSSTVVAAQ